jgi:hypothetical protein
MDSLWVVLLQANKEGLVVVEFACLKGSSGRKQDYGKGLVTSWESTVGGSC